MYRYQQQKPEFTPEQERILTETKIDEMNFDKILALEQEETLPFGVFQPILKPYFPRWDKTLSVSEWTFREGAHIFKVSLGKRRCRLALPADASLDLLASMILNALSFDHRFLYDFGDCWEISVALEDVDPKMGIEEPVLLDAKGQAPEQYPGWG